jgi:hypothetical protein
MDLNEEYDLRYLLSLLSGLVMLVAVELLPIYDESVSSVKRALWIWKRA